VKRDRPDHHNHQTGGGSWNQPRQDPRKAGKRQSNGRQDLRYAEEEAKSGRHRSVHDGDHALWRGEEQPAMRQEHHGQEHLQYPQENVHWLSFSLSHFRNCVLT